VTHSAPQDIHLDVLYEDADLLVIDKHPGLVVHPGAGNASGTLVNALLHRHPELAALPRAGIVHRLDKETSGALIVARTLRAHTALVEQLAERDIHRQYEAVVNGVLVAGGTVNAPLDRHPVDRLKRAVVEDGKPAVTHYRVRERFRAHTHIECVLETGRTHQIRVHMAHVRHPLVGDPLYGGSMRLPKGSTADLGDTLRGFRRQALHAEKVEFAHPAGGATVSVQAPRPADLARLLDALRGDAQA
jgi:23S rRNA pseudouridine1911/1915/1917 synthase